MSEHGSFCTVHTDWCHQAPKPNFKSVEMLFTLQHFSNEFYNNHLSSTSLSLTRSHTPYLLRSPSHVYFIRPPFTFSSFWKLKKNILQFLITIVDISGTLRAVYLNNLSHPTSTFHCRNHPPIPPEYSVHKFIIFICKTGVEKIEL